MVCQEKYPIFVVGKIQGYTHELDFVYEELNRFERLNIKNSLIEKETRILPSIFILPLDFKKI